jgi:phosphoserine phosphatase RsbU/P
MEMWPTGPIVGVIPDAQFTAGETVMEPNDLLCIYTDGVTDALNTDQVPFGRQQLIDLLMEEKMPGFTCDTLLGDIALNLSQFIGAAVQFDDITTLAVRRLRMG